MVDNRTKIMAWLRGEGSQNLRRIYKKTCLYLLWGCHYYGNSSYTVLVMMMGMWVAIMMHMDEAVG